MRERCIALIKNIYYFFKDNYARLQFYIIFGNVVGTLFLWGCIVLVLFFDCRVKNCNLNRLIMFPYTVYALTFEFRNSFVWIRLFFDLTASFFSKFYYCHTTWENSQTHTFHLSLFYIHKLLKTSMIMKILDYLNYFYYLFIIKPTKERRKISTAIIQSNPFIDQKKIKHILTMEPRTEKKIHRSQLATWGRPNAYKTYALHCPRVYTWIIWIPTEFNC